MLRRHQGLGSTRLCPVVANQQADDDIGIEGPSAALGRRRLRRAASAATASAIASTDTAGPAKLANLRKAAGPSAKGCFAPATTTGVEQQALSRLLHVKPRAPDPSAWIPASTWPLTDSRVDDAAGSG